MNIWAHRGVSQLYPENTMTAFEHASAIQGLAGIELDIQLTSDGELVVIHDERVDRTTDGMGFVRDYTYAQLRQLHIYTGTDRAEHIPSMREVLELLRTGLLAYDGSSGSGLRGFRLNIELKNSVYPYPGMEEKIVNMVSEYGIGEAVLYSSFYADSLVRVKRLDPTADIGVLDGKVSDCLYKALGIEKLLGLDDEIALHPSGNMIDLSSEILEGRTVRAYFGGHLYPEKPTDGRMGLDRLEAAGVTDVFLNDPAKYVS